MKNKSLIIAIVVLAILLFVVSTAVSWLLNRNTDQYPDYSTISSNEMGLSLFYDTLQHMQFPVATLHRPAGEAGLNDVVLIVQPSRPHVCNCMTEDILNWVRSGGRLIFLENSNDNVIDMALENEQYTYIDSLRLYRLGLGEVLTGRADIVANINLMYNPSYGENIARLLSDWNPSLIYFAEYYHGFAANAGAIQQLPLSLQVVVFQVILVLIVLTIFFGKRFGSVIPYYEELERDENEQVLVLARLYKQADRRK